MLPQGLSSGGRGDVSELSDMTDDEDSLDYSSIQLHGGIDGEDNEGFGGDDGSYGGFGPKSGQQKGSGGFGSYPFPPQSSSRHIYENHQFNQNGLGYGQGIGQIDNYNDSTQNHGQNGPNFIPNGPNFVQNDLTSQFSPSTLRSLDYHNPQQSQTHPHPQQSHPQQSRPPSTSPSPSTHPHLFSAGYRFEDYIRDYNIRQHQKLIKMTRKKHRLALFQRPMKRLLFWFNYYHLRAFRYERGNRSGIVWGLGMGLKWILYLLTALLHWFFMLFCSIPIYGGSAIHNNFVTNGRQWVNELDGGDGEADDDSPTSSQPLPTPLHQQSRPSPSITSSLNSILHHITTATPANNPNNNRHSTNPYQPQTTLPSSLPLSAPHQIPEPITIHNQQNRPNVHNSQLDNNGQTLIIPISINTQPIYDTRVNHYHLNPAPNGWLDNDNSTRGGDLVDPVNGESNHSPNHNALESPNFTYGFGGRRDSSVGGGDIGWDGDGIEYMGSNYNFNYSQSTRTTLKHPYLALTIIVITSMVIISSVWMWVLVNVPEWGRFMSIVEWWNNGE